MIVVDEKSNFDKDFIKFFLELSDTADVLYVSSKSCPDSISRLMYPEASVYRSYSENNCTKKFKVYDSEVGASALQDAVEFAKTGGQVVVFAPNVKFKLDKMEFEIFNGWKIGRINQEDDDKTKMDSLNKFKDGNFDILICGGKPDYFVEAERDCFAVVQLADL